MLRYGRLRSGALPQVIIAALPLALTLGSAAAQAPGDALNADAATGAVKVCSPVAMPRWRSMTPVPKTWTFTDCMAFSGEMGATDFQLGCLFTNVTPYAQKYAWGPMVKIQTSALAKAQPPVPNCGW